MSVFGRSLFGGILSGLIMVSGAAACAANATAVPEVRKVVRGSAVVAARAQAKCYKTVVPPAKSVLAAAVAQGAAQVAFFGYNGLTQPTATAFAYPQVDYFGAGEGVVNFTSKVTAFKRTRARPLGARFAATVEGEGYVYQLAYGQVARGVATGFGTTYYVGIGNGVATALGVGADAAIFGAKSTAIAQAVGEGMVFRDAGAQGVGAGVALLMGDAAVTREGVREFEGVGAANAAAAAGVSTTTVYQVQSVSAGATATGRAAQQRGGKAKAAAKALATGDSIVIATGVVGAPGTTTATATARAKRLAKAYGEAKLTAKGTDHVRHTVSSKGAAILKATLSQLLAQFLVKGGATARADGTAIIIRTRLGYGAAVCTAQAQGYNAINDLLPAPPVRTHTEAVSPRLVTISPEARLVAVAHA